MQEYMDGLEEGQEEHELRNNTESLDNWLSQEMFNFATADATDWAYVHVKIAKVTAHVDAQHGWLLQQVGGGKYEKFSEQQKRDFIR
jgi:hypothetical protein